MKINTKTYRFFAAFTALLVFLSISLPAGLHAKHMDAGHCEMAMPGHEMAMPVDMQYDCDTGFSCACSMEQPVTQAQAPNNISKDNFKLTPVVTEVLLSASQPNSYLTAFLTVFHSGHSIPLFLKNSSFLN